MRCNILGGIFSMATLALLVSQAHAQEFKATLSGFEEIGELNNETGAIFSPGTGKLHLNLNPAARNIAYKLTYSSLTTAVTQAHIHFGKFYGAGGIIVFLCSNLGNGPTGTKACPSSGGTVW